MGEALQDHRRRGRDPHRFSRNPGPRRIAGGGRRPLVAHRTSFGNWRLIISGFAPTDSTKSPKNGRSIARPPAKRSRSAQVLAKSGAAPNRWRRTAPSCCAPNILRELEADYQRICSNRFDEVAEEWEKHCKTIGEEVVIRTGSREIRGRAESLAEDGALLLRTEHGRPERIVGGDVTHEK